MSRCTPGHGWTSRKRKRGGLRNIETARAVQAKQLEERQVDLVVELRKAEMDYFSRSPDDRSALTGAIQSQINHVQDAVTWLAHSPLRVLSPETLEFLGITQSI